LFVVAVVASANCQFLSNMGMLFFLFAIGIDLQIEQKGKPG